MLLVSFQCYKKSNVCLQRFITSMFGIVGIDFLLYLSINEVFRCSQYNKNRQELWDLLFIHFPNCNPTTLMSIQLKCCLLTITLLLSCISISACFNEIRLQIQFWYPRLVFTTCIFYMSSLFLSRPLDTLSFVTIAAKNCLIDRIQA